MKEKAILPLFLAVLAVQSVYVLHDYFTRTWDLSWARPIFSLPDWSWSIWIGYDLIGPNWILFCAQAVIFYFVLSDRRWACLLEIVFAGLLASQAIVYVTVYGGYDVKTLGASVAVVNALLIYFLIRELGPISDKPAVASSNVGESQKTPEQ